MSLPPLCAWVLHVALHTRRRDSAHLSEERCADTLQEQEDEDELDDVEESFADNGQQSEDDADAEGDGQK